MSRLWLWKCAKCAYRIETHEGKLPDFDPSQPHAKDGEILKPDDQLDITKMCFPTEFIKQ